MNDKVVSSAPISQRFYYLDGLRGVASLIVANFHFLCAFLPQAISEYSDDPWIVSDTPLAILWNGGFAVSIFFVLSGFVIANSAAKRHLPLLFNLTQRYFRLALPILASTIFAWLMLTGFPHTVGELKAVIPSRWLNHVYDGNLPDLSAAIASGLVDVFVSGHSAFNNVLWTMKIELIGSCLIYLVYTIGQPRIVLVALCTIVLGGIGSGRPEIAAFAMGALLRECVAAGRLPIVMPWPMLLTGIVLGAMMEGYDHRVIEGWLNLPLPAFFTTHRSLSLGEPHRIFHLIASTLVLYGFLTLPRLQRIFMKPSVRFLGDISFGFYLVHVVLIYTVIGELFLSSTIGVTGVYVIFIAASLSVGYLFTVMIDRPVMRAIHRSQKRLLSMTGGGQRAAPQPSLGASKGSSG